VRAPGSSESGARGCQPEKALKAQGSIERPAGGNASRPATDFLAAPSLEVEGRRGNPQQPGGNTGGRRAETAS